MNVSHDMQAYFVAFTLVHEVPPTRTFGIDRANIQSSVANLMGMELTQALPAWYKPVHRATIEVGANTHHFMLNLAEAYLDWLYAKNSDCQSVRGS